MKIIIVRTIKAPIKKTFDLFSDIQNASKNVSAIKSIDILSNKKEGEGLKWRETRVMFGKEATEEMWISHFDSPKQYDVLADSHGMKYHSIYSFEELGPEETKVIMTFEGTPTSLSTKLLSPLGLLFVGATKKALEADMDELKSILEKSDK